MVASRATPIVPPTPSFNVSGRCQKSLRSNKIPSLTPLALSALLHGYVSESRSCRVIGNDTASQGLAHISHRNKLGLGTFTLYEHHLPVVGVLTCSQSTLVPTSITSSLKVAPPIHTFKVNKQRTTHIRQALQVQFPEVAEDKVLKTNTIRLGQMVGECGLPSILAPKSSFGDGPSF